EVREEFADAAEAALGDLRFALLVAPEQESLVFEIAQGLRFPGPIYSGVRMGEDSEAGPVRLGADAPAWLARLLDQTTLRADGSFLDEKGHWPGGASLRFLGSAALEITLARTANRLAGAKTDLESINKEWIAAE